MDSKLYEEIGRRFISEALGVPLDKVGSPRIRNPQRPEMPKYEHQIDLYWETGSDVVLYLNIANAKWRTSEKVTQDEVLLLQQVRQQVGAHKAMVFTPTDFTAGSRAAAADHGIGLHIVQPSFDCSGFPTRDRAEMQAALARVTGQLYSHRIVHRGADFSSRPAQVIPSARPAADYVTREATALSTRASPGPGYTNRGFGGPSQARSSNPFGGAERGGQGIARDGGGGLLRCRGQGMRDSASS